LNNVFPDGRVLITETKYHPQQLSNIVFNNAIFDFGEKSGIKLIFESIESLCK